MAKAFALRAVGKAEIGLFDEIDVKYHCRWWQLPSRKSKHNPIRCGNQSCAPTNWWSAAALGGLMTGGGVAPRIFHRRRRRRRRQTG